MDSFSPLVAWLLVLVCISAAAFFGWQQIQTLRRLHQQPEMPADDRTYFRRQAIRRLIGCGLLVAIGVLIGGSYVSGQEEWVERLAEPGQIKAAGAAPDAELQHKKRIYVWYWIAVLLLLLALVIIAAIDFFAIRGYGARHLKRIYSDRKAMLEQELAELKRARGYRNGEAP